MKPLVLAILCLSLGLCGASPAADPKFDRIVIDDNFPGAYQVEVADVNGDRKPDIVAVGGGTCAWYENPSWKKRIITDPKRTPGIISSASADLDGDGKAEVAIAYEFEMNRPRTGKLLLAWQGANVDDPWITRPIADVGSIHRVRWCAPSPGARPDFLAVAPIFGPEATPPKFDQAPATILRFLLTDSPRTQKWEATPVGTRPVLHSFEVHHGRAGHGPSYLFTADNLGVGLIGLGPEAVTLVPGVEGPAPKRGASEVHLGRRKETGDGWGFLATVEPWHGNQVAVYPVKGGGHTSPPDFGPRTLLDDTLDDGHALWVADIDGDGTDEVFAGHRGKDHRVSVYRLDGEAWKKAVIDREIAAQDLRGGDLDGDGTPDVVAVGGSTHNVVWYRPSRK